MVTHSPTLSRRQLQRWLLAGAAGGLSLNWAALAQAQASALASLTNADASAGVKALLTQGAGAAIDLLGQSGGYLNNPLVRIALPSQLNQAAKLMRQFGLGAQVDGIETAMNSAAEQAVPQGKDVLLGAIQGMSVSDAKGILTGGDTSVTDFFSSKTRGGLTERFTPIVQQTTNQVALVQKYDQLAGTAARYGLLRQQDANLAGYVTGKTVDGLYTVIGQQERALRQDPVSAGSALLTRVLGGLK
ncbi:hypothetical protein CCO03_15940 [Comamonas serinivorans]|uniref:DUF4197 domain-containing protein n=1 Tax=Comamonas serinivorans TaxID=1082851 RepID=A0A1Y0ERE2_9BURK|nr:DUF4197 domain-containing protein [Comamonas serinivorans]ARU05961.1 hypothetical protein CCO03_15940 [Comamonas serinivorans]